MSPDTARKSACATLLLCALLLLPLSLAAEIRTLTILHINDFHARLMPLEDGNGGMARLATAIRHEREGCTDCILVNAGDLVQGEPVSTVFKGLPVFELANMLGIDAATLGNHDFDYGWRQTKLFLKTAKYPIVNDNIIGVDGKLFTDQPYVILKVNGLRVAVVGAMMNDLASMQTPSKLEAVHTIPSVETSRKYAIEAREKSDLVILVAHIAGREEREVLETVPEIQVSLTGHAHGGMQEAAQKDGRLQVRVRAYGAELGRLELKVDTEKKAVADWKWKKIAITPDITPAEDVAKGVKIWEDRVTELVDRPLATANRAFSKQEVKRLIEKAMCAETGSDFAWMNQGGVRDLLPKGQLLERHVWNIMPFDNEVLIGKFKGRDLPAVVVGTRQVDPDKEYTLAVSDYTAANQGTGENLRTSGLEFPKEAGLLRDMIISWIRKQKVLE